MNAAMFTQLTISVQGKKLSGKTRFAEDLLLPMLTAVGGTVVKADDNKTGVFITASLPQGLFPATRNEGEESLFGSVVRRVGEALRGPAQREPAPELPRLGDDVEVRDGVVRAKELQDPEAGLLPINSALLNELGELLARREIAQRAARDPRERKSMVKAPGFVFAGELDKVVEVSAVAALRGIDARLKAMGLRWEAEG